MFTVGHEVLELKTFTKQLDHDGRRFVARYFTVVENCATAARIRATGK